LTERRLNLGFHDLPELPRKRRRRRPKMRRYVLIGLFLCAVGATTVWYMHLRIRELLRSADNGLALTSAGANAVR
jgi:hypothetical protein